MLSRKTLLLLSFLFVCALMQAQSLPAERYTSKNGLISDRITAIAQDDEGFMWFGSYFGMCRYNGISFEKIDLPPQQQNRYVTFLSSANHKMYAGFLFSGGLAEWSKGKASVYFVRGKDSAAANEFLCMHDNRDGSLLLCNSSRQLYQFKEGKFSLLYAIKNRSLYPSQIIKDRYNNIWISSEGGLCIVPYPYNSEYFYFNKEIIFSLSMNSNGRIWFGKTNGIRSQIINCEGWKDGTLQDPVTVVDSSTVVAAPFFGNMQKGFWAVDPVHGLLNLDGNNHHYYKLPIDYGTDLKAVFTDRENNIWIANEPGVWKVSNFNAQSYSFNELAAGGGALQLLDSEVWSTNAKALYQVKNEQLEKINFTPLQSYIGQLFIDSKKDIWFGLWNDGLWHTVWKEGKLVSKKFFAEYHGISIKSPSIIEDSQGNIWTGGNNGIFQLRNDEIIAAYHPKTASGSPAGITAMALDETNKILWLGDNAEGIIKLHYDFVNGTTVFETLDHISQKNGLDDGSIRSLVYDGTDLWAGTRLKGIYRIHEENKKFSITNCNAAAGLSCTRVIDIKKQNDGTLWFATCNGVYRYQPSKNHWSHLNTSNGILNAEVFSIQVDEKNNWLWTLTSQGITKLQLNSFENRVAPLINIIAVTVSGKADSTAFTSSSSHNYSSENNSISFSFVGSSFIDEKNLRYKYMLEGYDKDWSQPTATNTVNYASLPPGHYIFKVMVQNAKGQWCEEPANFSFGITLPFYKRSWFIFLLITIAFTIIYLVRMQQLKNKFRIEKLRLSIARDLHDDVGATLGSINILSKTATRKLEKLPAPPEFHSIFQKIGHSAEQTLEAMDDIVWSINPEKDKLQDLFVRIREYAIPLLEAKNISFHFQTEGDLSHSISMNLRRNLFLVFKEAIHNVLKHSAADAVTVFLEVRNQQVHCKITDNGHGFAMTKTSNRNGLKNMHQRAEMTNGVLKIQSSESGTVISFRSPLR